MKIGFYPKLAWEGIRKNKRLYFPYILTGCVMVMMFYIMSALKNSPSLTEVEGGSTLSVILPLGCIVIGIFSLLFMFYTNSFLIKQRYREFGLYNILGMDKKNISRIMIWESIFTIAIVIIIGLAAGILLSKAAELILLNLLNMTITYTLSIEVTSIIQTSIIFCIIYLLLLINSIVRVRFAKPLELMQTSKVGERVPKMTWLFALAGIILLAAAYWLAVSIESPLTALFWFFIAVIMVIIGTYLVFIAGSVVFCKLLQKNKKYYYQPNHFISVSSMVYRMKRNGAGLASICILLTMVLVMITFTSVLYFGAEDSLKTRYPNDVNITMGYSDPSGISDENIEFMENQIKESSGYTGDLDIVRYCSIPGLATEDGIIIDYKNAEDITTLSTDGPSQLSVISLTDYNQLTGENKTLADNECFISTSRIEYEWKTFTMEYGKTYTVKETIDAFVIDGDLNSTITPTIYLVVDDLNRFFEPIQNMTNHLDLPLMTWSFACGFDTDTVASEIEATNNINAMVNDLAKDKTIVTVSVRSYEMQRNSFYNVYGSLFFLGIILSIVFLLAAVLIIYYKQISEGYEDYSRFDIMQKVGMTKHDIRKSINSQMLTVFFAPLILAGIHLTFAFPFIEKILNMFAFDNTALSITVNIACFTVCGFLYALVYKITSGAYYTIVSGKRIS